MRWIACLMLAMAFAAPSTARGAEPVDALVARVLDAYGGAALPGHGDAVLISGRTHSLSKGAEGKMVRELIWPGLLRFEIAYEDGSTETRLLKDGVGWRDGEPTNDALTRSMRLQAARLALPMLLTWEADKLRDLGEAQREDGVMVRRLRVDLDEDLVLFVEIGVEHARVLRTGGVMRMGEAKMEFGAVYSEFQAFGDISWPSREDQFAMGRATGWTVIESVSFDSRD